MAVGVSGLKKGWSGVKVLAGAQRPLPEDGLDGAEVAVQRDWCREAMAVRVGESEYKADGQV